jgi:hypothetical protein
VGKTTSRRGFAQAAGAPPEILDLAEAEMIYVDDAIWYWQGLNWCHLLADDIDELHRFALRLGIAHTSYQGPPKTSAPHYDLTGYERHRAIALGAKPCSREEIVAVFRVVRSRRTTTARTVI